MKALQSTEERMLVLVLISIVVLFVCCTTPAAVLSVLYSVKLDDHLGFQVGKWLDTTFEMLPVSVYQGCYWYQTRNIRQIVFSSEICVHRSFELLPTT